MTGQDKPLPPAPAPARVGVAAALTGLAVAVGFGVGLMLLVRSNLLMTLLTQAVIGGLLATGVGILLRQNGVVSFGHAAFFGLATYSIGLALKHNVIGAEIAVLLALLLPTLLAFLLGIVIVRIPGVAFSMLTLAVGQALFEFAVKAREVTGGDDGFAVKVGSTLFGLPVSLFQKPHSMFVIAWVLLCLTVFGLFVMVRSHLGQLTEAIRENEERARFIGYETVLPRAAILAISAFVAALAGVLAVLYNGFVSPENLHWSLSGSALIMVIIGGPKLLWGPSFGAIIYFFFKDFAGDVTEHWQAVIGLTLIAVTVLLPQGIGGALVDLFRWVKERVHG